MRHKVVINYCTTDIKSAQQCLVLINIRKQLLVIQVHKRHIIHIIHIIQRNGMFILAKSSQFCSLHVHYYTNQN